MITQKKLIPFIALILITLLTLLPFFNSKFFYTQDHIFIARLQQMSIALSSGQFPVRWAPDLRFGEPLFNFYAPLPYYLGSVISLLGLNFIWVAKVLFVLSSILSALTMYLFCRKLFTKYASFVVVALYTLAPYRAVDLYVRGALSEAWAFVFFPLIFYASTILSQKVNLMGILLLAFSLAGLILTHNVMTLMFLPFLVLWWIYIVLSEKNIRVILSFLTALIFSLGLSASFLLPALLERQFIQTQYLLVGYFDFRAHFVAYRQFFSTFWGYGSSLWGPKDGLSFQIGPVHWAVFLLAVIGGLIYRKNRKFLLMLPLLGIGFFVSIFLQHNKSAFLWEAIPLMAFIQFPWRFLAISIFFVSIMGGVATDYFGQRFKLLYLVLIVLLIIINFQYFRPKEYVDDSFFDKFLNTQSMRKGVDLTKDYLPIWVKGVDGEVFETPRAEKGEIIISEIERKSTSLSANIQVISDSLIEAPITYFPGWEVWTNDRLIPQSAPSKMGLIRFELPKGNFQLRIELKDTLVRTIGNMISLGSLLLGVMLLYRRYKQ